MYGKTLSDPYWWPIRDPNNNCRPTGELVPFSRFQDPCWRDSFDSDKPYPAVLKILATPLGGTNGKRMPRWWWDFTRVINPPEAWLALRLMDAGWINWAANRDHFAFGEVVDDNPEILPRVEGITSVGNYHLIRGERNNSSRIEAFKYSDMPPDPEEINPQTHPWLFCRFTSISEYGQIGNAPKGLVSYFPILVDEEGWIPNQKLELGVTLPKEPHNIMRAYVVDVSRWQDVYLDDGIDEGFPLDGVIQKCAHGLDDYTEPTHPSYSGWWKLQYDSIAHFEIRGGYQFFETELGGVEQAELALKIANSGLYRFMAVDFEAYHNQINLASALELKKYLEHFWANSDMRILLYTNKSIYASLRAWLGSWMDNVELWIAGGPRYNLPLNEPLDDSIVPELPSPNSGFRLWQVSADGNLAADEFDFGTAELASIDVDIYPGTAAEFLAWIEGVAPPSPGEWEIRDRALLEARNTAYSAIEAMRTDEP